MSREAAIERARRRGFFPLVYLLERLAEGRPRVGEAERPEDEPIRFLHDPSLGFAGDEVRAVRRLAEADGLGEGALHEVTCTFLGLTGAATPLPLHMAELAQYDGPEAARIRAFLAPFHHRLLSLLVQARRRTDIPAAGRKGADDPWSHRLRDLVGAPEPEGEALPAWLCLRLAPLLSTGRSSLPVLERALDLALSDLLGPATVSIAPLTGAWGKLSEGDRSRLGQPSCALGRSAVLGARMRDLASRFRVSVGPLDQEGFGAFQPGALGHERLRAVVRAVVRGPAEYELSLRLLPSSRPQLRLGAREGRGLGRDSWLAGRPSAQEAAFVCSSRGASLPHPEESACA